jgi:uncharacterized protein
MRGETQPKENEMEWQPGNMSSDIEDRRNDSGGGGGGFGFGGGGGGIGIIGVIVLVVLSLVTGRNFIGGMLSGGGGGSQPAQQTRPAVPREHSAAEDRDAHLISVVLDDVQQQWTKIFAQDGKQYRHAKLVLFRGATYSGCGTARASTGPFYCPQDEKVYIDLDFWDELKRFGGSTADFAQAYVIAHELGHHVQKLKGIEGKVTRLQQQEPGERNHLSVDLELQADCFAGVWAHSYVERGKADASDISNALNAATAVGDDHLQKMSGRAVSPESWTHGSSAQREKWFNAGLNSGDPASCNTFGGGTAE